MAKANKKKDPNDLAPEMALKLLARREHSRRELELKLLQRRVDSQVAQRVLDDFEERGWLCDERFAEVFARQRMDAGYGPLKILADLQGRGVARLPAEVTSMSDAQWVSRATQLRNKRFGLSPIDDDWKEQQRQGAFLARRGFSMEQIERVLQVRGGG